MNTNFPNTIQGAKDLSCLLIGEYEKNNIEKYKVSHSISTIFIAGAPGAGKTEFLETVLISEYFIVIDIDKYRNYFEGYNGKNAELYQDCSSRVATKIFDYCIKNNLKIIFDGTLTSEIGVKNIEKSMRKNRKIGIILIYQDPIISYLYTLIRQEKNERKVSMDAFIRIYYNSIKYSFEIIKKYKNIHFIVGSKNKNRQRKQIIFTNKEKFDKYFKIEYNENALKKNLEKLNERNILQIIQGLWKKS